MILGKKIIVTMPAYNAEKLLAKTYREVPRDVVDLVILVDDASQDRTVEVAKDLGIDVVIKHERNLGYGGNQKTCYQEALRRGGDVIMMLHPDYQYTPALIEPLAWLIAHDTYDVALGSRMLGKNSLSGGMPFYKYCANRSLTFIENIILGEHLAEYHTGYRVFSRRVLETVPFIKNSNQFLFDNQILAQIIYAGFRIGEVSCPTRYFPEASSMNLKSSLIYGLGVLKVILEYRLHTWGWIQSPIYEGLKKGRNNLLFPSDTFPELVKQESISFEPPSHEPVEMPSRSSRNAAT